MDVRTILDFGFPTNSTIALIRNPIRVEWIFTYIWTYFRWETMKASQRRDSALCWNNRMFRYV